MGPVLYNLCKIRNFLRKVKHWIPLSGVEENHFYNQNQFFFTALKGTHFYEYILFVVTAGGVVPCTSSISQFIFNCLSFVVSRNIPSNQEIL